MMTVDTPPGIDDDSLGHWVARARSHAKLADAVLGDGDGARWRRTHAARSLGALPGETFELDLDDPEQRRFGDYELVEKIGQGGMGVVYRARQRSLDREVAIKILAAGPWANADHGERFQREARHAARLVHPNIVAVHEIARIDDIDYFSMRLVRGDALSERIARDGAFEPRHAARLLRTLAEALSYAHSLGVLHLDLKPGNVLLEPDGTPLVADFGLARRFEDSADAAAGEVSGTPSYMSPEQAEPGRGPIGPATDVWGLGTILYECLTAQPPFRARSAHATMRAVLADTPLPPRALAPAVPRDLEAICLACLAKDPARRYPSARALADDLGRFVDGVAVSVRPDRPLGNAWRWARREPRTALASALALFALAAGLVATTQQWRRAQQNAEEARRFAAAAQRSEGAAQRALWSNRVDSAWQAAVARDPLAGLAELVENLREQEAAGARDAAQLERARIGALLRQAPVLVDALDVGEVISAVALDPALEHVAIGTPAGDVVYVRLADGLARWRTSTLGRGRGAPQDTFAAVRSIRFVREGRALLVRADSPGIMPTPGAQTFLLDVASGAKDMPSESLIPSLLYHALSDDARHAVAIERLQQGQIFSARVYAVDGWKPLGGAHEYPREMRAFAIPRDGRVVASTAGGSSSVELFDPAAMRVRARLALDAGESASAWAFSPDGRWLALGSSNGRLELVATADAVRHALEPAPDSIVTEVEFDPAGRLLFAASRDGSVRAWDVATRTLEASVVQLDGSVAGIEVDAARRSVLAVRDREARVTIHRAPDARAALAVPVVALPPLPHLQRLDPGVVDLHGAQGLLATALGTELRLWRLPRPALPALRGAPERIADLVYDGEHLASVADTRAVVVGRDGRPVSGAFDHDAPVAFAHVHGEMLWVVANRTVHAWRWREGVAAYAPIARPASIVRLAVDERARRYAIAHGEYRDGRYHEIVSVRDAGTGLAIGPELEFAGPLRAFHLDAGGERLAAVRENRVEIVPIASPSRRVTLVAPEAEGMVRDVALARDGASAWTIGGNPRVLRRWSLPDASQTYAQPLRCGRDSNDRLDRHDAVGAMLLPDRDGRRVVVNCTDYGAVVVDAASVRELAHAPRLAREQRGNLVAYERAAALDPGARRYARALRNGAIVVDLEDGRPIAPVLEAPLESNDRIVALAFAPDGQRLVASTALGRIHAWDLPVDTRALAEIERDLAELVPGSRSAAPRRTRAELRARDPGAFDASPLPPLPAARLVEGERIAPRVPGLAPQSLDLAAHYNAPLVPRGTGSRWSEAGVAVPRHGPLRAGAVDYDVRGRIETFELSKEGSALAVPDVAIAPSRLAAVHVLVECGASVVGETGAAIVATLRYADGSHADLPIVFGRDPDCIDLQIAHDGRPRIAYASDPERGQLFAVRLANPRPERFVRAIGLRSGPIRASGHAVYAITLEPAARE